MPLLNGTHRAEYLIAAILATLMAIGGVVILLIPEGDARYGIPLLFGGAFFAVSFGEVARRRYSKRPRMAVVRHRTVTRVTRGVEVQIVHEDLKGVRRDAGERR